jgi:hypothetical protein
MSSEWSGEMQRQDIAQDAAIWLPNPFRIFRKFMQAMIISPAIGSAALYVDARCVVFRIQGDAISEISSSSQDILGAAEAQFDFMKALDLAGMAKFPADNGVRQGAQGVPVFISVQHD